MNNIDANILIEEYAEYNKRVVSELMMMKAYIKQLEDENRDLKIKLEQGATKKTKNTNKEE